EALGTRLWPANRADYERWLAVARAGVSGAAFAASWQEGRALPLEQAVAGALAERPAAGARPRRVPIAALLTPRERGGAELVARGLPNRQIAGALVITEKTAANHVQHVLDKLEVRSRARLAARAAELGLAAAVPWPAIIDVADRGLAARPLPPRAR